GEAYMISCRTGCLGVTLAVLLSLAGLAISALLLQHHVVIEVGGSPLLSGVCQFTEHASCDAVLSSEWARWPRDTGLPTALWGLFFFAGVFSWYLVVGRPSSGSARWLQLIPMAATAVGAGICVSLAVVMYTRMPNWCPL